MHTFTVCFDPDEASDFKYFPYRHRMYDHRRQWATMTMHDRAADLMRELKRLNEGQVTHIYGVTADWLEDNPEQVDCNDPNALAGLVVVLRKIFNTAYDELKAAQ